MNPKAFVISTATALSLGYGAGLASDFDAKAAQSQSVKQSCEVTLPAGAQSTVETFLVNQCCANINSDLGLSGADVCGSEDIRVMSISWQNDGAAKLRASFEVPGTWTPGAPE